MDTEKNMKTKNPVSLKKTGLLVAGLFAVLLICIYLGGSFFFMNRYYLYTQIGDISCGGKTPEEVKAIIAGKTKEYSLTVYGREGLEDTIASEEIGLEYVFDDTLDRIAEEQNGFFWLTSLWSAPVYEMPVMVGYNNDNFEKRLDAMYLFQKQTMRKPSNAYIGEYDDETKSYLIVEEDLGTTIDVKKAKLAIKEAVSHLENELYMEETGAYLNPEILKDDQKLKKFCDKLNKYVSARIVYDWNGTEVIVDGDIIHSWLKIDQNKNKVEIDGEAVREFVNTQSKANDTYGRDRDFITTDGRKVTLKSGGFGWRTDRAEETEELIRLIKAGKQTEKEPVYLFTGAAKGKNDIGDSYVEIDLGSQHLYLYVEGEMIVESDFVSGNVSRGFTTPPGVFGLTYKTRGAVLRGPGYATPVDFWMPFNGNIGMHDAGWRKKFGGNIYQTSGSHGCVNLPPEVAEEIYEYVHTGFPVVCYY